MTLHGIAFVCKTLERLKTQTFCCWLLQRSICDIVRNKMDMVLPISGYTPSAGLSGSGGLPKLYLHAVKTKSPYLCWAVVFAKVSVVRNNKGCAHKVIECFSQGLPRLHVNIL